MDNKQEAGETSDAELKNIREEKENKMMVAYVDSLIRLKNLLTYCTLSIADGK